MKDYRAGRKRKTAFIPTNLLDSPLDLYDHLPFQIAVVSNLLQLNRDMVIRDIIELEPRELRVILNIGSYMPIIAADIAYQARLDSYTVSRAVKQLKSMGIVEFTLKPNNKKDKLLVLTEKGKKVYFKLHAVIEERTNILESVLSKVEIKQLMDLLAKLEDSSEAMLAQHAQNKSAKGEALPADQMEIIRWWKKSTK